MDWKAETLAGARRARMQANNLHHNIDDLKCGLHNLEGYASECALMEDAITIIEDMVEDLFKIEGKLSR